MATKDGILLDEAMAMQELGRVQDGTVVLKAPINLPDGTEVLVHIEVVTERNAGPPASTLGASARLARADEAEGTPRFYGLWADRAEMEDSTAWLRKQREAWTSRVEIPKVPRSPA